MADIIEIVDDWVDNNKMFTAFDVTLKAQELGDTRLHRNLRDDIHDAVAPYVDQGLYERTRVDTGLKVKPWLYHPVGADVTKYESKAKKQTTPNPTPAQQVPVPKVTLSNRSKGALAIPSGRTPDKHGAVCVPKYLISQTRMKPGDVAILLDYNHSGQDYYTLEKYNNQTTNSVRKCKRKYKVDKYGNIRIAVTQLGNKNQYDFGVQTMYGKITIEGQ